MLCLTQLSNLQFSLIGLLVLSSQSAFFEFLFRTIHDNVVNCLLTIVAVTRRVVFKMLSEHKQSKSTIPCFQTVKSNPVLAWKKKPKCENKILGLEISLFFLSFMFFHSLHHFVVPLNSEVNSAFFDTYDDGFLDFNRILGMIFIIKNNTDLFIYLRAF